MQGDTADFGLQYQRDLGDALVAGRGHERPARQPVHGNLRGGTTFTGEDWILEPGLNLRYGTDDFISRYYAVEPA